MTLQGGVFLGLAFLAGMFYGMSVTIFLLERRRLQRLGRPSGPYLMLRSRPFLAFLALSYALIGASIALAVFGGHAFRPGLGAPLAVGGGMALGPVVSLALFWLGRFQSARRTRSP